MMRAPTLILAALFAACGGTSEKGQTCSKTGDCRRDLVCIDAVCVDPKERAIDLVVAIESATILYMAKHDGTCPSSMESLSEASGGFDQAAMRDPWGNAWIIECSEDGADITSPGPDQKPGTDDDISTK